MSYSPEEAQGYIESILQSMVDNNFSDAFLHQSELPRIRNQGTLMPLEMSPCSNAIFQQLAILANIEHWNPNETYDRGITNQQGHRFRLSLFHQLGGPAAVVRKLNTHIPNLEELRLPFEMLHSWVDRSAGLILIAGPPGSGKSTTCASMLDWLNDASKKHIVCIEDPAEFLHANRSCLFTHREVGHDTPSFAKGMEQALRQSPDIIFLGEIRDTDTARATLHAAETGHLVIATLHGSSTTEGLERFIQIFNESERDSVRLILSGSLVGILFQKLLAGTDGQHIPATEYFENQGLIRRLIRENRINELRDFIQDKTQDHQSSFLQNLVDLAKNGWITEETARQNLSNPQDFQRAMKGIR
ncbi:MAG: PilT/PilU family type 4a pilus ATPase [Verrucomicrobiota bacterium]